MTNQQKAFGQKLRLHREKRGTSLETIAQHTKISALLFSDLEQGNCARWPPRVYSRAYVRSYAAAVGLKGADLVAEFCECFPEVASLDEPPCRGAEDANTRASTCAALRLTFGHLPDERKRHVAKRAATVLVETLVILVLGSAVALVGSVGFTTALAAVALTCHILAVTLGHSSLVAALCRMRSARRSLRRETPPTEHGKIGEITAPDPTVA